MDEKISACQIPDDILKKMDAETLIQAAIDYPLLLNAHVFDTPKQGYDSVFSYANVCQELLKRSDIATHLLARYIATDVADIAKAYVSENPDIDPATLMFIEGLLSYEPINAKLSEKEKTVFNNEVFNKFSQRSQYPGIFAQLSNVYYQDHPEEYDWAKTAAQKDTISKSTNETLIPRVIDTRVSLKTPLNNTVYAYKRVEEPGDITQLVIDNNKIQEKYPKATQLSGPTYTYNCHSYAWYSENYTSSTRYWINWSGTGAQVYTTEGSHKNVQKYDYPDKITYGNGDHSAIVTTYSLGAPNHVTSK